jgi:hypothetical protein
MKLVKNLSKTNGKVRHFCLFFTSTSENAALDLTQKHMAEMRGIGEG